MEEQALIKEICKKELEYGCYEAKIDGVSIYSLIRSEVRHMILRSAGYTIMPDRTKYKVSVLLNSVLKSVSHILNIYYSKKKCTNVFYSFARVDAVAGLYLDKFSDPIIDECGITDYVILDRGRAGVHPQPRLHSENVIFVDAIQVAAELISKLFWKLYVKKHKWDFEMLDKSLKMLVGNNIDHALYKRIVLVHYNSILFGKSVVTVIESLR